MRLDYEDYVEIEKEKMQSLTAQAEAGDVGAMVALGRIYAKGYDKFEIEPSELPETVLFYKSFDKGELDFARSAAWYDRAARSGDVSALYGLGLLYFYGYGVEKDERRAATLFAQAEAGGHVYASFYLGYCYARGKGVDRDGARAVEHYLAAAEQGYLPAYAEIGRLYMRGDVVERNQRMADEYFVKAKKHRAGV